MSKDFQKFNKNEFDDGGNSFQKFKTKKKSEKKNYKKDKPWQKRK